MDNLPNQFTKSLAQVTLTPEARARMRGRLEAHLKEHPAAIHSPYARFFATASPFTAWLRTPVVAGLALMVIAGGATTLAAQGSLPGDTLYPVKVGVLEPARGLFALTPESQVAWNVARTETRLVEVEKLAEKGTLTPEEDATSKGGFDSSVQAARSSIEALAHKNPEAAAQADASFAVSLGSHKKKLLMLGSRASTTEDATVRAFAEHISSDGEGRVKGASTEGSTESPSTTSSEAGGARDKNTSVDSGSGEHPSSGASNEKSGEGESGQHSEP